MRDYKKPSKQRANEEFLKKMGISKGNPYPEETIELKKLFLIICEGENTEPCYFRSFPVPSSQIIVEGGCHSKTSLVNYALDRKDEPKYAGYEIWCVFDFDVKPDQLENLSNDFNSAIQKAKANGLQVAWSNDAFELWFLLHYDMIDVPLSRHEIYPKLKKHWELEEFGNTAKTRKFCEDHYKRHGGTQSPQQLSAIKRARALHELHGEQENYSKQCPCTTVYLLVEELNKHSKD